MIDLKMTDGGELVLGTDGDLALTYGDEQIAQEILFKLKTTRGDWLLSPSIGCSLEEFIGQPNTRLTHVAIERRVLESITSGGSLFFPEVSAISIGENEVFILIEFSSLESDDRVIQIQSSLDLKKGSVFSRMAIRELN